MKKKKVPYRVQNTVRKGELLVTSNFSFSHNVFYNYIFLVRQNVALCGDGLRLIQIESISRQQFKCGSKTNDGICIY